MTTKLKTMMIRKGISQAELARLSAVDSYRISRYANGCAHANEKTLDKFAAALGCKPGELIESAEKAGVK